MKYINKGTKLQRAHLAPLRDFKNSYVPNSIMNICPQWNTINNGNVKLLEGSLSKISSEFIIITGTFETLLLPDIFGELKPIYLNEKKIPVPKYIWKIIQDQDTKEAFAFVILNNPFIEDVTKDDFFNINISKEFGFVGENWTDIKKGFTFVCDANEINKIFNVLDEVGGRLVNSKLEQNLKKVFKKSCKSRQSLKTIKKKKQKHKTCV